MMTRQKIIDSISKMPLPKMKSITVECRPPEKSNQIFVVRIREHNWYCERPTYFWSKFDLSFVEKGLYQEQKTLYPRIKEPLTVLDRRGLLWQRYEMSSFGLVEYFLTNPANYLSLMAQRTHEMEYIIIVLKKIRPTLRNPKYFEKNLKVFKELFTILFNKTCTVYALFDELAWQFRKLLLHYLPKDKVNIYFSKFLSAEIVKFAMRKNYISERGAVEYAKTRGILYAMNLKPRLFYVPPKFFHAYSDDSEVVTLLIRHGIPRSDFNNFLAFRLIVPLGFQINEESQYIETSGLSAHLGILVKAISKRVLKPIEYIYQLDVDSILKLLQRHIRK